MARSRKKNRTSRRKRNYNRKSYRRRQPNKRGRKSRKRHGKNIRKRQRGGFSNNLFLSKPQHYPPRGSLAVPNPGIQTFDDSKYFYSKNNKVTPTPNMELPVLKRGGNKYKKQKGGSFSSALESAISAFPGGTDIRDVYWSSTNKLSNLWNNWNGFSGTISPLPSVQPIGKTTAPNLVNEPDIAKIYDDAGKTASSKPYQAYN